MMACWTLVTRLPYQHVQEWGARTFALCHVVHLPGCTALGFCRFHHLSRELQRHPAMRPGPSTSMKASSLAASWREFVVCSVNTEHHLYSVFCATYMFFDWIRPDSASNFGLVCFNFLVNFGFAQQQIVGIPVVWGIPVILSDFLAVPFQGIVDWTANSLNLCVRSWHILASFVGFFRMSSHIPFLIKLRPSASNGLKRTWARNCFNTSAAFHWSVLQRWRFAFLEEAACFFDFHRGYGTYGHGKKEWIQWSQNQVALGGDCPYVGHGDGETLEACHSSCKQSSCNLVNFHDGDCVLRQCRDPAQPALTGGAAGWQVWSMINETQLQCSPYHAIFKTLNQRHKNRPFTHG